MKTRWMEIIIIVLALGLLSICFAAWDNTKPADSDAWNTAAGSIRNNWDILEAELGIDLNEAHPYYQATAPAFKPDGATAFDGDDLGRIWIDSDNERIFVLTATVPTWTAIILELANDTYFTAVDNAGTGTVDLIMANASDVAVLPDGSELATSGAPTADADIANKKYVDDQLLTGIVFSAYTDEDSETNAMLKAHAYKAATTGFVTAFVSSSAVGQGMNAYVGLTDNPEGARDLVQSQSNTAEGYFQASFPVAKDEYFELTTTSANAITIRWKSVGTLSKPVDQD